MKIPVSKLKVGDRYIDTNFCGEDYFLTVVEIIPGPMYSVTLENEEGERLTRMLFSDQYVEKGL